MATFSSLSLQSTAKAGPELAKGHRHISRQNKNIVFCIEVQMWSPGCKGFLGVIEAEERVFSFTSEVLQSPEPALSEFSPRSLCVTCCRALGHSLLWGHFMRKSCLHPSSSHAQSDLSLPLIPRLAHHCGLRELSPYYHCCPGQEALQMLPACFHLMLPTVFDSHKSYTA